MTRQLTITPAQGCVKVREDDAVIATFTLRADAVAFVQAVMGPRPLDVLIAEGELLDASGCA